MIASSPFYFVYVDISPVGAAGTTTSVGTCDDPVAAPVRLATRT